MNLGIVLNPAVREGLSAETLRAGAGRVKTREGRREVGEEHRTLHAEGMEYTKALEETSALSKSRLKERKTHTTCPMHRSCS